jgi:hypothetical protein
MVFTFYARIPDVEDDPGSEDGVLGSVDPTGSNKRAVSSITRCVESPGSLLGDGRR